MLIKDYLILHIQEPEKYTLGPNVYSSWKILVGKPSSTGSGSLAVQSKSDPIPSGFEKAAQELNKRGGRAKFVQQMWLVSEGQINQRIVKGICSAFLTISPHCSSSQLASAVAMIQWMEKFRVKEKYAQEFEFVRDHINEVLYSVPWGSMLFKKCF